MKKPTITEALLKGKPMTFQEITSKCNSNRNHCHEDLKQLLAEGLIRKDPKNWRQGQPLFFSLTKKGIKDILAKVNMDLETSFALIPNILEKTSRPEAIRQLRREAAFHPTAKEFEAGCIEAERIKEMNENAEWVLAPLKHLFFELAKDLLKADNNTIGVREDLENVEFFFREGKPYWTIHPDKSYWSPENRL